ncbi:hypothetical protein BDV36DRAFT_24308 [Aspergillus pseudocaelatus]|uniref:Uncharacterized protein n=1 Tax=Aspergillus pseudocaelatus TaxID=1825620 RepID=A0ABQ6W9G8_9EURO|nr:hypothetical protein BDV36DRAFT_24308 [Aspergillus pseudocaelatus]
MIKPAVKMKCIYEKLWLHKFRKTSHSKTVQRRKAVYIRLTPHPRGHRHSYNNIKDPAHHLKSQCLYFSISLRNTSKYLKHPQTTGFIAIRSDHIVSRPLQPSTSDNIPTAYPEPTLQSQPAHRTATATNPTRRNSSLSTVTTYHGPNAATSAMQLASPSSRCTVNGSGAASFVQLPSSSGSSNPIVTFAPQWSTRNDKLEMYFTNAVGCGEERPSSTSGIRSSGRVKNAFLVYYNSEIIMMARCTRFMQCNMRGRKPEMGD